MDPSPSCRYPLSITPNAKSSLRKTLESWRNYHLSTFLCILAYAYISNLGIRHDKPTLLGSDLAYSCTCGNHGQPRTSLLHTIATGEPVQLKRRQSDLTVWAGLKPKASAPPSAICKGKILITSEDDDSHPAGIKGQRITVKIEH